MKGYRKNNAISLGSGNFFASKTLKKITGPLLLGSCYSRGGGRSFRIIHCMVPRETVGFVFLRVLMFPETKLRETLGLKGKQN